MGPFAYLTYLLSIKMSKISPFFSQNVWAKYLSAYEISYLVFFRKCYGLLSSNLPLA